MFVLIETYWNVNVVEPPPTFVGISINRNILECKFVCFVRLVSPVPVLIETYWNVNLDLACPCQFPVFRINRNILECK